MNDVKEQVIIKKLNNKIKNIEERILKMEETIQKEKSSLGSIIANNKEAAPLFIKACKAVSGMLFGLGLPYAFIGNYLSAAVAFGSSLTAYGLYTLGTRLDKHDKIWRKKCLNRIEIYKNAAKEEKVKLYELYKEAANIKEQGVIIKDAVLEEEIKKDLQKQSFQKVHKTLLKRERQQHEHEKE